MMMDARQRNGESSSKTNQFGPPPPDPQMRKRQFFKKSDNMDWNSIYMMIPEWDDGMGSWDDGMMG